MRASRATVHWQHTQTRRHENCALKWKMHGCPRKKRQRLSCRGERCEQEAGARAAGCDRPRVAVFGHVRHRKGRKCVEVLCARLELLPKATPPFSPAVSI